MKQTNRKGIVISLTLLTLFSWNISIAQQETKINDTYESFFNGISIRGYIGTGLGVLAPNDGYALVTTEGSAAVILNHKLAIGATGTGFVGTNNSSNSNAQSMYGGFGGILVEPILMPKKKIHLSFPVSFGGGQAEYVDAAFDFQDWDIYYSSSYINNFIYVKPGVNLEFNLTKFMRVGVTGSYLVTNSVGVPQIENAPLDGANVSAKIKFGWFK